MKLSSLCGLLLLVQLLFACAGTGSDDGLKPFPVNPETGLRIPYLGPVPELPEWEDNPSSEAKAELGRFLFNDPRLSGSGRATCGNCHFQGTWFQSNTPQDVPDRSYPEITPKLARNAPSLLNIVYAPRCRWDGGHCENLYDVMMLPFAEPNMNLTPGIPRDDNHTIDVPLAKEEFRKRVVDFMPGYVEIFDAAFDVDIRELDADEIWLLGGKALAVLMRDAVSKDSDFDRWNAGDDEAMDEVQVRGLEIFLGEGGCVACHSGPLFSDFNYHNLSREEVSEDGTREDEGRYLVTGKEEDRGKFLTPTLRGALMTSPFYHDGSEVDIRKVIGHITGPDGKKDPLHSPFLDTLSPLSAEDTDALVEFLKALVGPHPDIALFSIPFTSLPNIDTVQIGQPPRDL